MSHCCGHLLVISCNLTLCNFFCIESSSNNLLSLEVTSRWPHHTRKKVILLSQHKNNQSSCLNIANPKFYCWVVLFLTPIIEQLTFGLQFYFHLAENSLFYIVYCCFMCKCCWVFKKRLYSIQKIYITHWLLTSMILRVLTIVIAFVQLPIHRRSVSIKIQICIYLWGSSFFCWYVKAWRHNMEKPLTFIDKQSGLRSQENAFSIYQPLNHSK